MAADSSLHIDDQYSRRSERAQRPEQQKGYERPGGDNLAAAPLSIPLSLHLLKNPTPSLRASHNQATRIEAFRNAQQTFGNRAVQRFMDGATEKNQRQLRKQNSEVSVQRVVKQADESPKSGEHPPPSNSSPLLLADEEELKRKIGEMNNLEVPDSLKKAKTLSENEGKTEEIKPPPDKLAAFKQLATGNTALKDAPKELVLPEELTKGMNAAWGKSFTDPDKKSIEQGGILVNTKEGGFAWKPGVGIQGDLFTPNFGDVDTAKGESLIGSGHTHPYDKSEGGDTDVSFSRWDLSSLVNSKEKFQMVQSGKGQFVSARTAEFDKRLKGLDDKGKAGLKAQMEADFATELAKGEDKLDFKERVRAANLAVHKKYELIYYEGADGKLSRAQ